MLGRGTSARDDAAADAPPAAVTAPVAAAPAVLARPLDEVKTRADIIALAAQAADALAAGQGVPDAVRKAAGQRFRLRLPFGCQGPSRAGSDAAMRWRYDEEAGALRVHVAPAVWNRADLLPATGRGDTGEVVEGFWLARPWTGSEACPPPQDSPTATGSETVTLPGQTLAVVRFADDDAGRQAARDDKPFETVVRMSPDEVRADRGFQLRITGRIADVPGHGPVSCRQPAGAEQRPICTVAITMDDVAIDNPLTGRTLATWNVTAAGGATR